MKKIYLSICFLSFNLISIAQLSWLQLPDFPGNGRVGCSSFAINGKGYMGLGMNTNTQGSTDWYEFDPVNTTWTQKASFPAGGRYGCVNYAIGGKGYVVTGSVNGTSTNENWEYDAALNTWTAKANFPGTNRQSAAGFSIGTKGYVGTGYIGGSSVQDFYEYDSATDSWTVKTDFPGAVRNTCAGFSIGSKGYLGLGTATNSAVNYNDVYEYDPGSDSWAQKADFPITYIDAPTTYSSTLTGFVLCGYYYQTSGITHNPLNTLYSFDPVANVWSLKGTFRGLPRGYAGGFSIANDIYLTGGTQSNDGDPSLMLNDLWKLSNGLTLMAGSTTIQYDFTIFPNPVSNTLYFSINSEMKIRSFRIYDASGKLVLARNKKEINPTVDVSRLSKGTYLIEVVTQDKIVLDSKFIKE